MGGINRIPTGLLDFLLTQAGGRNPDNLLEQVRPVVDLEPFYYPDRWNAVSEAFSLSEGQRDFIEVPAGEAWLWQTVAIDMTIGASSQRASFAIEIERIPGQGLNGIPVISPQEGLYFNSVTATGNLVWATFLPRPFLLTAGQRIVVFLGDELNGPINGSLEVTFIRLNIG